MTSGLDRETLELSLEAFRDFATEKLPDDVLLDLDERDEFPVDLVRELCGSGLGIQLLFIDEEFGGMGGGAFDVYRICEALAQVDLGIATGVLATFLGSDPIRFGGTEEQKSHWLGRIAEEGLLFAYCATEPEAGSDLGALKSTAERVEEDGELVGYSINGSKQWISNGGYADVYTVLATAPDGPSWFIVEAGADGLSPGQPEDKHGIRASNTAAVGFTDVLVAPDRLVGGREGQGLLQAQAVFGYTRLMVAAFGLGGGWAALDRAIPYSMERVQGGSALSEKQGFTHKLVVPNVAWLEAGRAYIEETARRIDGGEGSLNTEGAIAKYLSSEAGLRAAEASIQALGGYGYTREYLVEKIRRDVRITTIYEGTSEILEMTIARDLWQLHLKTRGEHFHERARTFEALHAKSPDLGADTVALTFHALAAVLERSRVARLTRNQHLLFRLGELIAYAEGAAGLVARAAGSASGSLDPKADRRFSAEGLAVLGRICARQAASLIASQGLQLVIGAGGVEAPDGAGALETELNVARIHQAQQGLIDDMNLAADLIYDRRSD
jgi:alkylation response protein AidB-like acyl-CoA dehydrogenase